MKSFAFIFGTFQLNCIIQHSTLWHILTEVKKLRRSVIGYVVCGMASLVSIHITSTLGYGYEAIHVT